MRSGVVNYFDAELPHTGAKRSWLYLTSHDPDLAEYMAMIAHEGQTRGDIDLALITGDLARTGADDDLETAFDYVNSPAKRGWLTEEGKPTLRGTSGFVTLLPGNHDRYAGGPACFPGGVSFDTVFAAYWGAGQGVQLLRVLTSPTGDERLAIVGADLSLTDAAAAEPPHHYFVQ